jgi:hypothetical protein
VLLIRLICYFGHSPGSALSLSLTRQQDTKRFVIGRHFKDDSDERFVAVLEIPPVTSPETAVKVAIAAEVKGKQ